MAPRCADARDRTAVRRGVAGHREAARACRRERIARTATRGGGLLGITTPREGKGPEINKQGRNWRAFAPGRQVGPRAQALPLQARQGLRGPGLDSQGAGRRSPPSRAADQLRPLPRGARQETTSVRAFRAVGEDFSELPGFRRSAPAPKTRLTVALKGRATADGAAVNAGTEFSKLDRRAQRTDPTVFPEKESLGEGYAVNVLLQINARRSSPKGPCRGRLDSRFGRCAIMKPSTVRSGRPSARSLRR